MTIVSPLSIPLTLAPTLAPPNTPLTFHFRKKFRSPRNFQKVKHKKL